MRRSGFAFLMMAAIWFAPHAVAKAPSWVETFQSSPAAYGVGAPEVWAKSTANRITTVTGSLRFQLPVSVGGQQLRIRFSNETGTHPLTIGTASVALASGFDGAANGAIVPLTFGGEAVAIIPAGAPMLSDPVALPLKAGDQILISVSVPDGIDLDAYGATGMWSAPGDQTRAITMTNAAMVIGRPIVSGMSVLPFCAASVVVTLGDSITAGGRKIPSEIHGWPEALSRRLNADDKTSGISIINAGIAGNRILSDGYGQGALARLDRDVLRMGRMTDVIVFEGINDIGFQGRQQFGITQPNIEVADLIAGYRQIIIRAHAQGAKVTGVTLLPFARSFYYTSAKEEMRQIVNNWIRTSGEFDDIVDLDAVIRDPENPLNLRKAFDSGDHLHPNLAGEAAIAQAISVANLSAYQTRKMSVCAAGN